MPLPERPHASRLLTPSRPTRVTWDTHVLGGWHRAGVFGLRSKKERHQQDPGKDTPPPPRERPLAGACPTECEKREVLRRCQLCGRDVRPCWLAAPLSHQQELLNGARQQAQASQECLGNKCRFRDLTLRVRLSPGCWHPRGHWPAAHGGGKHWAGVMRLEPEKHQVWCLGGEGGPGGK